MSQDQEQNSDVPRAESGALVRRSTTALAERGLADLARLTQSRPWATLFTWNMDGVYQYSWISWGTNPLTFVPYVAAEVAEALIRIVEHHAEAVNCADLDWLHESYGSGEYPEDGWGWSEVCELLRALPEVARQEVHETFSPAILESSWYDLIDDVNYLLPDGDGVWASLDAPLPSFLNQLLGDDYSDQMGSDWRVAVARLSQIPWDGPVPKERWRELSVLFAEYPEIYSG